MAWGPRRGLFEAFKNQRSTHEKQKWNLEVAGELPCQRPVEMGLGKALGGSRNLRSGDLLGGVWTWGVGNRCQGEGWALSWGDGEPPGA